jgi:hypothetical protein
VSNLRELLAPLEVPPGPPPVTSVARLQTLPFQALRWDDFERLCLRLARLDHDVEDARRYGVAGQSQYGIDLYARHSGADDYTVYQCKKVDSFGPADITSAVAKFLAGPWAQRATRFVLCTTASFAPIQLADRLEEERNHLAERGVSLEALDADKLDLRLKDLSELVDDFFGRQVVIAFCGQDAADGLARRLDGGRVAEYRQRLQRLYSTVFGQYDPGLPVPPRVSDLPVDLRRRYVVADVEEQAATPAISAEGLTGALPGGQGSTPARADALDGSSRAKADSSPPTVGAVARFRQPLGVWLAGVQRGLLMGETGSGKSSALRFVTLDLFDERPVLADVAAQVVSIGWCK